MTVRVRNLQSGGVPRACTFADTFNRASGALGTDWFFGCQPRTPIVNNINGPTVSIGAAADLAQAMRWNVVGSQNPGMYWFGMIICVPVAQCLDGVSQFSEWQLVRHEETAAGANNFDSGPAIFCRSDGIQSCYVVRVFKNKSWALNRNDNGTMSNPTGGALNGGAGSLANNDVIRLRGVITSTEVTLQVLFNNVSQGTTTDVLNHLTVGSPGFCIVEQNNSGAQFFRSEWRNFACGKTS